MQHKASQPITFIMVPKPTGVSLFPSLQDPDDSNLIICLKMSSQGHALTTLILLYYCFILKKGVASFFLYLILQLLLAHATGLLSELF